METTEIKAGSLVRHRSTNRAPMMIVTEIDEEKKSTKCKWWDEASNSYKGEDFLIIELEFFSN